MLLPAGFTPLRNETHMNQTSSLSFTKMHGLGNDYLYAFAEEVPQNIVELSVKYSDRHFGVGSDGIICILPSDVADFQMRIFNADGSEAMMCGNGIRCVGKYVHDKGHTDKETITVETKSGIKTLDFTLDDAGQVALVSVDMGKVSIGEPIIAQASCGFFYDEVTQSFGPSAREVDEFPLIPVDMGNPHAVIFCQDAEAVDITKIGPALERSGAFPDGVNVEFVQVIGKNEIRMRVWERGSGVTMACGTGSCASVAASIWAHKCTRASDVTVHLDGGDLIVSVDYDNNVKMAGPAAFVCDGVTIG